MLHWLARARADLIPPARTGHDLLLDLGCGGGLMAPYVSARGYRHVGVDLVPSALGLAAEHGVEVIRADLTALPFPDGCVDVVCAGEVLEHVADLDAVAREAVRVLRPGGLLVADTLAATRRSRLLAVRIAERLPGLAPHGVHDPDLFVDRERMLSLFAGLGVDLQLRGLRPSVPGLLGWLLGRRRPVRMRSSSSTAVLFQAWGIRERRCLG
jgi:2-polyprenyl-6-hydroxyphenyl methylase/3-demethylubiquinone-9 3-methyltransferase